jgi:hypothetical protein
MAAPITWSFFHDLPTKSYPSSRHKIPWVLLAWAWEVSPGNKSSETLRLLVKDGGTGGGKVELYSSPNPVIYFVKIHL